MGEGTGGGESGSWVPARDRTDPRAALRILVGLLAVFVAVLAALALLNSFFIEPQVGPTTPTDPGPADDPGERGGEGEREVSCQDIVDFLLWTFIVLTGITALLLGAAILWRHRSEGRILTNVWGILAIIVLFFTLLAAGAWKLIDWLCNGAPSCRELIDGFFVTYLVLIFLTVGLVAAAILLAHLRRVSFFRTGLGVLGLVLYLPALISGVGWWVLRTFCNPQVWAHRPCGYLQDTMTVLAWTFWLGLLGAVAALGVGILYHRKTRINGFRSGWAVLAIMLVVLAALSGMGWFFIKDLHDALPFCVDPEIEELEEEEPPTCRDLLDRLGRVFWVLLGGAVVLAAVAIVLRRKDLRRVFGHPAMIVAYVALALALIFGLIFLILSSFCEGEGDEPGQGGQDPGPGVGGGGGGGTGPGGGGGSVGRAPVTPVQFDPLPMAWLLAIVAGILVVGLLVLLLRRRAQLGGSGPGAAASAEVSAAEADRLRQILAKRKLESADAIIAAYRVFLAWAAGQAVGKEPHETPREHARRVAAKFPVDPVDMQEFVRAYEVVRLSDRIPTEEERRLAVRFSREILRDLPATEGAA